jgi:serine/threonine protein phosphatase PrpC
MKPWHRLRVAFATHRGRVRSTNEDCIGVLDWTTARESLTATVLEFDVTEPCMCIVADGLGGHEGGEVASRLSVRHLLASSRSIRNAEELADAIRAANRNLYEAMALAPSYTGMGATIAGLLILEQEILVFNVGDCRAYGVVPGPFLRLLTTDDLPKRSGYDPEARTGVLGHSVTQCLGGASTFKDLAPHIISQPAATGRQYLLCSDGITDNLDIDEMENSIKHDIEDIANNIVTKAIESGGSDNLSVLFAELNPHQI